MADPASEPPFSPTGPLPVPEMPTAQTGPKPFSTVATAILTVLLLVAFSYRNWAYLTRSRADLLTYPSTPLFLLHEGMLYHEAVQKLPRTGRIFLTLTGESNDDIPHECEVILRDSIAQVESRNDTNAAIELRAHLVVLLAETSAFSNAVRELDRLPADNLTSDFRRAFHRYYQTNTLALPIPDNAGTNLLSGWANWRFTARWLKASGKLAELEQLEKFIATAETRLLKHSMAPAAGGWLLHVVGLAFLVLLWKKKLVASPHCDVPALPWSAQEYWGLFVRGYLFGLVLEYVAVYVPGLGYFAWLSHAAVSSLPIIGWLAVRHWLRNPASFRQFFGIPDTLERASRLVIGAITLFGICWLSMLLVYVTSRMIAAPYWAEAVDEVLLLWPWPMRLIRVADGVVFGPFLEEVLFRGLLFGALRSRLNLIPAAAISAAAFGLTHFYSLPGFLGVTMFGFLCAIGREKTGSLLVPIVAHMLTNLFLIGGRLFASL